MVMKLRRRHHRTSWSNDLPDSIQRLQMLPGKRQGVQRRKPRRTLAIREGQISADTPPEARYSSLDGQGSAEEQQLPGLRRFHILAQRPGRRWQGDVEGLEALLRKP